MATKDSISDSIQRDPSCMDDFDPNSMEATRALQHILNQVSPLTETIKIPIREALSRTLAHWAKI